MDPQPDIVPGVHRLGIDLVNWYLVEENGRLTAVDAGLPGWTSRLEADLAALGHSTSDVEAVVLTHADSDHTGVAAALQEAGARVLVHADAEPALRTGARKSTDGGLTDLLGVAWRPGMWSFFGRLLLAGGARPTKVQGAEKFADGDVLDVPGSPRVIATPGHTVGHCAIHFERHSALFSGDGLCTLSPPTGQTGPLVLPPLLTTSTPQCWESLTRIVAIDADVLLPGHGEPWRGGVGEAVARARRAGGR